MIKHRFIGVAAVVLMVAASLLTCFALVYPEAIASVSGSPAPKYVSAMDKNTVLSIQIVADADAWADMLENATREEYIQATVIIGGDKLENVGIRPKGNSSLSTVASNPDSDRYSFKIEFDHYITGQTWLGLDKLVVNNMHGDATYMKEYISYDLMSYIGVECPLYSFADISVNGEAWGFYLAVEALEESYAERVYGKDYGELYKPESMGGRGSGRMNEYLEEWNNAEGNEEVTQPQARQRAMSEMGEMPAQGEMPQWGENGGMGEMPDMGEMQQRGGMMGGFGASSGVSLQYIDDNISSYPAIFDNAVLKSTETDYMRVINALEKLSTGEDLDKVTDVEAVLRYFAAHTVVVNLDSYVSNMGHNYYLYEKDGQLTILPWDYNLAFGGFQTGGASSVVNFPIDTPVSGVSLEDRPLLGKLHEVPEYMWLYHSYLQEIVEGYFNSGIFESTVESLDAMISPYVESDPTAFYEFEAYKVAVIELKKLGLLRAESIEGQLNGTVPSTTEAQSAEPDKLINADGINLSLLGSTGGMGGGMRGGDAGMWNGGGFQGENGVN